MRRVHVQVFSFIFAVIGTIAFFKTETVGIVIALIALILTTGSFLIKEEVV